MIMCPITKDLETIVLGLLKPVFSTNNIIIIGKLFSKKNTS